MANKRFSDLGSAGPLTGAELVAISQGGVSKKITTSVFGTFTYDHSASSAALWAITHSLGRFPAVTIVDNSGNVVLADVTYVDLNTININFLAPFSGKAYLN